MFSIKQFQQEYLEWTNKNFKEISDWRDPLMGVVGKVGELSYTLLTQKQGVREDYDKHDSNAMNAVGYMLIYLCDLCNRRGWDMEDILEKTWNDEKCCRDLQKWYR